MKRFTAKFSNGQTWIGGMSFYPEDTPKKDVLIGIRLGLEAQGKIDETWELIEFGGVPVELTSDGAIIPKKETA